MCTSRFDVHFEGVGTLLASCGSGKGTVKMRMASVFIVVAGIGLLWFNPAAFSAQAVRPRTLAIGDAAPTFRLRTLDGKAINLSAYKGKVISLWFTNLCPGCQAAMPGIERMHKTYSKKGVTFLAISLLGDDTRAVREVVTKYRIPFPFLLDPK